MFYFTCDRSFIQDSTTGADRGFNVTYTYLYLTRNLKRAATKETKVQLMQYYCSDENLPRKL